MTFVFLRKRMSQRVGTDTELDKRTFPHLTSVLDSKNQGQDAGGGETMAKKNEKTMEPLMFLQIPEHPFRVKARASLRNTSRHIPVSANPDTGKEFHQPHQQQDQLLRLFRCTGIGGMSLLIQSALVADADAATVPGAAMSAHLQQAAVLGHAAVTTDVEMVTHRAEAPRLVVAQKLLGSIVTVATGGGAVDDKVFHGTGGGHHQSVLYGEKLALVQHLLLTDNYRKCFLYHNNMEN